MYSSHVHLRKNPRKTVCEVRAFKSGWMNLLSHLIQAGFVYCLCHEQEASDWSNAPN